jgi:hypothetical protein
MAKVKAIVDAELYVNIIVDKSGARNRDRIINISVNTAIS